MSASIGAPTPRKMSSLGDERREVARDDRGAGRLGVYQHVRETRMNRQRA